MVEGELLANPICNQGFLLSLVQKRDMLSLERSQLRSVARGQAAWCYLALQECFLFLV